MDVGTLEGRVGRRLHSRAIARIVGSAKITPTLRAILRGPCDTIDGATVGRKREAVTAAPASKVGDARRRHRIPRTHADYATNAGFLFAHAIYIAIRIRMGGPRGCPTAYYCCTGGPGRATQSEVARRHIGGRVCNRPETGRTTERGRAPPPPLMRLFASGSAAGATLFVDRCRRCAP